MKDLKNLSNMLSQIDFLKDQYSEILDLQNKMEENEITVSVMGQFKRGKSSVINALLNCSLLPVGIIPLTTVITEIRYDNALHVSVCFEDGSSREISIDQIEEYCSEQKNPGNNKNVSLLKIYTPDHPFGKGVVLSDTPGVGSVNKHNTTSSYDYISHSDVILFLLSVDSPVSESERDFLLRSRDFAAKFFFAVNKSDVVNSEDLRQFTDYCKETISSYVDKEVLISTISAHTGAGIQDLKMSIGNVLSTCHSQLLESSVERKSEIILSQIKAKLQLSIEAASATPEMISKKLARVNNRQKEMSDFASEIQVLSDLRVRNLIDQIDIAMEDDCVEIKMQIEQQGKLLYEKLKDLSPKSFEKEYHNELDKILVESLRTLNSKGLNMLTSGYEQIVSVLQKKAMDTALFISSILKDEFNIDYPVNINEFHVSERSDFILRTGFENKVMPDMNSLNHLLPKKTANLKFYQRSVNQSVTDIGKNKNNMLYNYKYKMQESLRGLCLEMIKDINNMETELENIKIHISSTLDKADKKKEEEISQARFILENL